MKMRRLVLGSFFISRGRHQEEVSRESQHLLLTNVRATRKKLINIEIYHSGISSQKKALKCTESF